MLSLHNVLQASKVHTFCGQRFIPENLLNQILTEDAIRNLLAGAELQRAFYKRDELIQLILRGGKKTLAILLILQQPSSILKFLERDRLQELDSRLPLTLEELKQILEDDNHAEEFYESQWEVFVPTLQKNRSHRVFDNKTILPYLKSESVARGGYGSVFKVTLVPSHQKLVNLDPDGNAIVIKKEIRTRSSDSENEEERILHSLRVLMHPNIIEVLASYSYGGIHSLLFPLADGDLGGLLGGKLSRQQHFPNDHSILRELHGLSSALETIHSFFVAKFDLSMIGCHHDLKPKNILVKGKKLLLTDFGMSRLEPLEAGNGVDKIRYTGFYYAPECISEAQTGQRSIVGRESDVWSFGCILATVTAFLESGPNGVRDFEAGRKTEMHGSMITCTFHVDGKLNSGYLRFLQKMKQGSNFACAMGLLAIIEQTLQIEMHRRPTMAKVTEALSSLAQKSVFDFSYQRFCRLLEAPSSKSCSADQSGNIELDTEVKRYYLWGKAVGITGELLANSTKIASNELSPTQVRNIFSSASSTPTEIENELLFLESWSSRSLSPSYFRLRSLMDGLWAQLPEKLQAEMKSALENAIIDGATGEYLQTIASTLQADQSLEYKSIGALAEIKYRSGEALTGPVDIPSSETVDEMRLTASEISVLEGEAVGSHSLGEIHGHANPNSNGAVLIEWVKYRQGWNEKIIARYAKIAKLFQNPITTQRAGLRVLQCVGYYRDDPNDCLGIFFKLPRVEPKPITLREYIQQTTLKARYLRPALGDLFQLAFKIAQCVLEVHKIGLVHKGISAYNIIFCVDEISPALAPISVAFPYLIGFNQCRRDDHETLTEGSESTPPQHRPYQHPEYESQDHAFRPHHDYYSLGLVLLEIGRWKPLRKMTKGMEGLSTWDRAREMRKECDENLANTMGVHYRDAVRVCLTSDFTNVSHGGAESVRDEFETKVINRLAKCVA